MSTRVGLIVTGRCEHQGLGQSLERIFPGVRFEVLGKEPVESFTSADVRQIPESPASSTLQKFAARIVAAVEPGGATDPPNLVMAVDDLELINASHPEVVVARVRERCSFHLLAPMVESYFFAEPAALVRAGAVRQSRVDAAAIDLEAFVTEDQVLGDSETGARTSSEALPSVSLRPNRPPYEELC